jgi:hypothetical protein
MRTTLVLATLAALFVLAAPAARADPITVVGPHPDANGGATCADVIIAFHVGVCEGAWSCPLYYDDYVGQSGCEDTPPVDISFLPDFELYLVHADANGGGASCGDAFAGGSHVGVCYGNLGCPVYLTTDLVSTCVL